MPHQKHPHVRRTLAVISIVASAALMFGALGMGTALAQAPITVELLSGRAVFTDNVDAKIKVKLDGRSTLTLNMADPGPTVVAKITVQPRAMFPWHTHPGPVVVNVSDGELIYVNASDCVDRFYPIDTAFIDPGRGNVHTAYNPSYTEVTILFATFFEASGPLVIGATPPTDCDVDV